MNRACAVGGEVRDPTLFHQFDDDALRAVFYEVRAVHEDDAGVALARGTHALNGIGGAVARRRGRIAGSYQVFFDGTQAFSLGQRIDLQFFEVERLWEFFHAAPGLKHRRRN